MRILLAGVFGGGYAMSGDLRVEALRDLGHEVVPLDYRAPIPGWVRRLLPAVAARQAAATLHGIVKRALFDLVIVLKGELYTTSSIRRLRRNTGVRVVNWFPDDPHMLWLSRRIAPAYDLFFTHDSYAVEVMRSSGLSSMRYLPFGCHPAVHHPYSLEPGRDEEYRVPVAFVGTYNAVRERFVASLAGLGLHVWGPGWERRHIPGVDVHGRPLYGDAMFRVFSNAAVCVNIHQNFGSDLRAYGYGANSRVFEVTACGGTLVSDRKRDLLRLFDEGSEVLCYDTLSELRERVSGLLHDPEQRDSLRVAGRRRALRDHTLRHRFQEMLDEVSVL